MTELQTNRREEEQLAKNIMKGSLLATVGGSQKLIDLGAGN